VAAKLYKAYGKSCNPKADFIPDLSTAPVHFPQTRAMTANFPHSTFKMQEKSYKTYYFICKYPIFAILLQRLRERIGFLIEKLK
jgi:hypothetical protein